MGRWLSASNYSWPEIVGCVYCDGDGLMVHPRIPFRPSFRSLIVPKTKPPTLFSSSFRRFFGACPFSFYFAPPLEPNPLSVVPPPLLLLPLRHTTAFLQFLTPPILENKMRKILSSPEKELRTRPRLPSLHQPPSSASRITFSTFYCFSIGPPFFTMRRIFFPWPPLLFSFHFFFANPSPTPFPSPPLHKLMV